MPNEQDVLNSINANPSNGYRPEDNIELDEKNTGRSGEVRAFFWETFKLIAICLAIIIPIRYYLVQPFFVKGASMEENFHDGDYLLIDELSYLLGEPHRGDVVVFRYPENPSQFYIKRIIGLPGETIEVKSEQIKIYNTEFKAGFVLKEYYLSENQETFGNNTVKLEGDQYFVMGDNRLQSSDSRRWGPVPRKFLIGKAFLRLWPVNKINKVEGVEY